MATALAGSAAELRSLLNPRLTADSFIRTPSNAMACDALRRVAGYLGAPLPNPLYIYSAEGLGKTHLAHALAHRLAARGKLAAYVTSEFFKRDYLRVDRFGSPLFGMLDGLQCLIIDDLQDALPKVKSTDTDYAFKTVLDNVPQVVIMANQLPHDFTISPDVHSRLLRGLCVEIAPMEVILKEAILERQVRLTTGRCPHFRVLPEVKARIVARRGANGRHIEGVVNRLVAEYGLYSQPASLETAIAAMDAVMGASESRSVTIGEIQRQVAEHFNMKLAEMTSSRRARIVARPRQVAMYLAKQLTPRSLPEIGRKFGGRDHTTVMHATRRIQELMAVDRALAEDVTVLRRQLER